MSGEKCVLKVLAFSTRLAFIIKIGMPKPTMLISMMNNEQLEHLAEDIEKRLISCINECK